jgi:hypothetical protein
MKDTIKSLNNQNLSYKEYKEQVDEWALNYNNNPSKGTPQSNYARILKM